MTSSPPAVSVLLPVYKAEPFVETAVGSLLAQSFRDWELIAVDDASPDSTLQRLEALSRGDGRIRVYSNQERRGVTGNWNECLRMATGTFVVKLDADDAFKPWVLSRLLDACSVEGRVGAGVRSLVCDSQLEVLGGYPSDEALRRNGLDPYADHVLPCSRWYEIASEGVQLWNGDAFMVRRELLLEMGGLNELFGCPSDTDLLIRLLEREGDFAHIGAPGVLYRKYEGSTSDVTGRSGERMWEGTLILLSSLERVRRVRPLSSRERRQRVRLWRFWNRLVASDPGERPVARERFEQLRGHFEALETPPWRDRIVVGLRDRLASLPV